MAKWLTKARCRAARYQYGSLRELLRADLHEWHERINRELYRPVVFGPVSGAINGARVRFPVSLAGNRSAKGRRGRR